MQSRPRLALSPNPELVVFDDEPPPRAELDSRARERLERWYHRIMLGRSAMLPQLPPPPANLGACPVATYLVRHYGAPAPQS